MLLRMQGAELNTHFVDLKKPMGVAFKGKRLSVGSGNCVIDYTLMKSAAAKIEPANTHDAAFLPKRAHITGDIDIHEMAFDERNELWIVNTKMSCLCTLDNDHSFVPQWRPPFITEYDVTDRCHLNGLAIRDGKPKYVTALGHSDQPGGWREYKTCGGILMDIESNEIILGGLSMPHSPRWYKGKLWVLESGLGQLITVDEKTGEKTVVAQVPGFCRGIDFIERFALIGLSEVRETAVFAGLPLTEREQDRECGVWIVDIETGVTVGHFSFTSGVQEIFSVQCLPVKYPELLDFNHVLLNSSFTLPNNVMGELAPANENQIRMEKAAEHRRRKEFKQAIDLFQIILEEDPENVDVQYFLGEALSREDRWGEAISHLDQVISMRPKHAESHNIRGHFYARKNDFDSAVECYDRAINSDKTFASAHFHRGCIKLKQGDYQQGWQGYEWRTRMPGFKSAKLPHPKWQGEYITDKTLLIVVEENAGDAIQFARFFTMAKKRCKKLIVACQEPLRLLFKEIESVDEVRIHGTLPIDLFDVYTSMMSLAAVLQIDAKTLPTQTPYLSINKQVVVPDLCKGNGSKVKIGLAWAMDGGDRTGPPDISYLEILQALTRRQDVDYFSFQKSISSAGREILEAHNVTDLEPELISFAHVGALMEQVDLMVCLSNATAHLCGALGLPTIVLQPYHGEWGWMSDAQTSTWYPGIEVLRQEQPGDWLGVTERCGTRIDQLCRVK